MRSLILCLFFVCICFCVEPISREYHVFKNGYDPLYNQMLTGSLPAYFAMMEARIAAAQRDAEISAASKEVILPEALGSSGKESTGAGDTTTTNGAQTTDFGNVKNLDGNVEPNSGDIQVESGAIKDEKSGNTETVLSGLSAPLTSGASQTNPSGLSTNIANGALTVQPQSDELPSGLSQNTFADPSAVLINNYYAAQGVYDLPFGGENFGFGYSDSGPADYFGAGDFDSDNSPHSFSSAPFRVVNDNTLLDMKTANSEMRSLSDMLATESTHAQKSMLAASNPDDEKTIRDIVNTKAEPNKAVVEELQRQKRAALQIADPYEISALHKLNEKMHKIQRFGQQQPQTTISDTAEHVAALKGLVDGIRNLRMKTEQQTISEPQTQDRQNSEWMKNVRQTRLNNIYGY